MVKKIILRADGNTKTGLGHLYRLFSLVEIVKHTLEYVFLTHETSTVSVIPEAYIYQIIPKSIKTMEEPEWLTNNFSPKECIIIADGYQFSASYQKQIKEKGFSLIYIDDLAKETMYADIVVNHSAFITDSDYTIQSYTQLALGTKHSLLRPEFLNAAKHKRILKTIDTAFVCFGGADPFNLTLKAVKALLEIPNFKEINIVLGAAHKHQDVFDLGKEFAHKIKIHQNLCEKDLIEVMLKSNFAIAPASTILYELCCVKMPILSGYFVDNQELIYKGFLEKGAIYGGDNLKDYDENDFYNKIQSILKRNSHDHILNFQNALFDNEIAARHLNLIKQIC